MRYTYNNFDILKVSANNTLTFLQGLTTADLSIIDNNTILTAFTNIKGRVISLSFITKISENEYLISVEKSITNILMDWLKKYGMFSRAVIETIEDYVLEYNEDVFLNHRIIKPSQDEKSENNNQIIKNNIFNKLPIINNKNSEKFLPADLELDNIENVVSYTKGCYMGQEVVARMKYKAKIKKQLVVIKTSVETIIEDKIKDENNKPLAEVVNSTDIDDTKYALVVMYNAPDKNSYTLDNGSSISIC